MKNILPSFTHLAISLILMSASCKKEKTGIDGLPPATQTGEQTFGCMVDGVLFVPKKTFSGSSSLECSYQSINSPLLRGYYFGLAAFDNKSEPNLAIYIQTDSLEIENNKIYKLGLPYTKGKASGWFIKEKQNFGSSEYMIHNDLRGELKITRLDNTNQIVSGTFWFDAVNDKGEKVEVREGRFDMSFTK